ncbi:MAG: nitroreductase [Phycisphaerales bacterium]|nr:MAG: nitroreductase [Phycisphaerales bacterium]
MQNTPPCTLTNRQLFTTLIRSASRAPSSHNTQPWLFRISNAHIVLLADRTRALPVNDPHDRELTISCGCALFNLRVEAAHRGLIAHTEIRLIGDDPDCLARVSIDSVPDSQDALASLQPYIDKRRTYRKVFATREVDASIVQQLQDAAQAEGAWVRPLTTEQSRHAAADLVAEGDAAQWANPSWRRELAAWMHARHRGDGLTVPTVARPVMQMIVRTFNMGRSVGAKDRQLAESSPLLAVLGTDCDGIPDWIQAGQALQRVLLVACQFGMQASYLNQPVQVSVLRVKLQDLTGTGEPHLLLRFGYPLGDARATPRRSIEDIIEFTND